MRSGGSRGGDRGGYIPPHQTFGLLVLKNRLRSSMLDERLNGLTLTYIHKDIEIDISNVINRFALAKKRKIDFVI